MNKTSHLFKVSPIKGKFTHLYHVNINDADYILKLRTEEREDNHLMLTQNSIEKQKEYLTNYKKDLNFKKKYILKYLMLLKINLKGLFD